MQPFANLAKGPDVVADFLMSLHARIVISPDLDSDDKVIMDAIQLGRDALQMFPSHVQLSIAVQTVLGEKWQKEISRDQPRAARETAGEAIVLATADQSFLYGWTIRRALATASEGDHQAAFRDIEACATLQGRYCFPSSEILVVCALCHQKAMTDSTLAEDQRMALSLKYTQLAAKILNEQMDGKLYENPANRDAILNDQRLESLRTSPALQEVFARLAK